jgi:hypothetical protein
MKKLIVLCMAAAMAGSASAQLWDQGAIGAGDRAVQVFSDFPTFSSYSASDFTVTGPGWNVSSVSIVVFLSNPAAFTVNATQARFGIWSKTGSAPSNAYNPDTMGSIESMSLTQISGNNYRATVNFTTTLGAGDYWVYLAPIAEFGSSGQSYHVATTNQIGAESYWRNPGGGFGQGTDWTAMSAYGVTNDLTLVINGTPVPEPATIAALGLGGLVLARRRRRKA